MIEEKRLPSQHGYLEDAAAWVFLHFRVEYTSWFGIVWDQKCDFKYEL
jgi:hypothetical protein